MSLAIQQHVSRFRFERTVDWRVQIPGLKQVEQNIFGYSGDDKPYKAPRIGHHEYLFAKSIVFPTNWIEIEDDATIKGCYNSKIIVPTVTMDIYTDGRGVIEDALHRWNTAAFQDQSGFMPAPGDTDDTGFNPIQEIKIQRINPISWNQYLVSATLMEPGKPGEKLGFEDTAEIIREYNIHGYLAKLADYHGTNSASIRTISMQIKVTKYDFGMAYDSEISGYKPNTDDEWVSSFMSPDGAKTNYMQKTGQSVIAKGTSHGDDDLPSVQTGLG